MTRNIENVSFGLGVAILTTGVVGMGMQVTHAHQGGVATAGSKYLSDHYEAAQQAFESGDHDVWKGVMGERVM